MTTALSMAEVLAKHEAVVTSYDANDLHGCACDWPAPNNAAGAWSAYNTHVAQALAAAGFGHVASVEAERDAWKRTADQRSTVAALARAEAAEAQVARVRALADEWEAPHATWCDGREACQVGAQHLPRYLRAALEGGQP